MARIKRFLLSNNKGTIVSQHLALPYVFGYPSSASLEISNRCNLRCPVCENKFSQRPKGYMSLAHCRIILDELGPHLRDLEIAGLGEAFLNPDIYAIIRYMRRVNPKTYVYVDTNGQVLDVDRLFEAPPDELVFAVDGLDQTTYEKYRVKGRLEAVIHHLKACIAKKRELSSPLPAIKIKFICMKHNQHQVDQVPQFCWELGADDYRIELFTSRTVQHAQEFMPTLPEYQKYAADALEHGALIPHMEQLSTPCPMLWGHANIYWDGEVVPCCTDYDSQFSWGNIFAQGSFWKIWNGPRARAFRTMHRSPSYRNTLDICRTCYLTNTRWPQNRMLLAKLAKSGRYGYSQKS
ncbi:MAG TPA: radical SAM protein [Syntrophales bacterium]|nr:radical SAM protein [Syntrophales bacterium]